jgi:Flp pilus assembly protein TadD
MTTTAEASGPKRSFPPGAAAAALGIALLLAYVVPLYAPPGPQPSPRLGLEVGTWKRLFPHVPTWWIGGRLIALALGSILIVWAARAARPFAAWPLREAEVGPPARALAVWCERAAFVCAVVLAAAATQADRMSRNAQLALVAAMALPVVLLRAADRRAPLARRVASVGEGASGWGWGIAVGLLVLGWVVLRVLLAHHDPRAADFVDVWKNFTFFRDSVRDDSSLVTQSSEVGVSNAYLLFIGLPLIGPGGFSLSFAWVQTAHAVWIAATAAGVALLVRRFVGAAAMLPAVATLLFSPFMLSMAVSAAPFALATALGAAILLLVLRIREAPVRADVAALGALAGLSATLPHLTLWGAGATIAVVPVLLRRTPSLLIWATAALVGATAVLPVLLHFDGLSEMSRTYLELRAVVAELEPIIMGQLYRPLREVGELWHQGVRGVLDVPLGTLLQPFAILRSPVRLSGDVYFEPIGAALAGVGIVACVVRARRATPARVLLVALALALLPGMLGSAFDRASLTRNLVLPALLPVFFAVGSEVARRGLRLRAPTGVVAAVLAAAIAASGIALFDFVNPRIVAQSWLGLVMRALGATPAAEVVVLEPGDPRWEWLWAPEITRYLPREPIRTRPFRSAGALLSDPDAADPVAPLVFWSPGLEQDKALRSLLCGCWPQAIVYEIRDVSGLSRVFAARLTGGPWRPAVPERQWSAAGCSALPSRTPPSCAALQAMAHYDRARGLADAERLAESVDDLREALELDPTHVAAHNDLGLALAAQARFEEAIVHYREAIRLDPSQAAVHNNLGIALESLGRVDEAIAAYGEAVRLAPGYPRGHLNLGAALTARGRLAEAARELEEVVRRWPDLPDGHLGLAEIRIAEGRPREAVAAYRTALQVQPGWPPASAGLAWLLATSDDPGLRDPSAALALASEAASGPGGQDPAILRVLAVALASTGDLESASATAERAARLAGAAGRTDLAQDLALRAERYGLGRP